LHDTATMLSQHSPTERFYILSVNIRSTYTAYLACLIVCALSAPGK